MLQPTPQEIYTWHACWDWRVPRPVVHEARRVLYQVNWWLAGSSKDVWKRWGKYRHALKVLSVRKASSDDFVWEGSRCRSTDSVSLATYLPVLLRVPHVLCSTLTVTEDLLVCFPRFIQVVQMNKEFRQEKWINQLVNSRVKNPIIPNVPLCTAPDEQQTVWTCKDCQAVAFFKKDFAKVLTDNVQKISNIVYLGLATVEDFPRWCEELLADCLITVETSDLSEELIKAHCEKFPPFLKQHGGEPIWDVEAAMELYTLFWRLRKTTTWRSKKMLFGKRKLIIQSYSRKDT